LIAAEYSGAKVKTCPNFVFGETNITKEYLAKFPTGKVRIFNLLLIEQNILIERRPICKKHYGMAQAGLR
jgi:hypothetical protein